MTSRQTSQGDWTYTWNALNQLLTASTNGVLVLQNWYDSFGRRIAKLEVIGGTTSKWLYVYDGWSVVAVLNGANGQLVESYTRGLGLAGDVGALIAARHHSGSWSGQTIYLHANHRGDVVVARYGTSTVGTYEYAPFGTQRSVTGTYNPRFRFSSKELDASAGLYYYGHRFYDPNLQRWLNRDPIGENGAINLYAFCHNNPYAYIDEDGQIANFIVGFAGGAVISLVKQLVTGDGSFAHRLKCLDAFDIGLSGVQGALGMGIIKNAKTILNSYQAIKSAEAATLTTQYLKEQFISTAKDNVKEAAVRGAGGFSLIPWKGHYNWRPFDTKGECDEKCPK